MRVALCLFGALACAGMAVAKSAPAPDVRAVQTDSTDVFQVLQNLAAADAAFERRDYQAARQGYESVLMHDPRQPRARSGLRKTFIALGDPRRAAKFVDDPEDTDTVLIRVMLRQTTDPIGLLKETLRSKPDPRLWTALGRLQDSRADYSAARQSYAMAGLAGARAGLADNNIGQSFRLSGDMTSALRAFERAVAADPLDKRFDNNRRRTLIALGETQAALAGLEADRAAIFLAEAGARAAQDGETRLARFLLKKSLDIAPRYNPRVAEQLALIQE